MGLKYRSSATDQSGSAKAVSRRMRSDMYFVQPYGLVQSPVYDTSRRGISFLPEYTVADEEKMMFFTL